MFEGKAPKAAAGGAYETIAGDTPGEDVLRALCWHDLTARLAAARDLRASLAGPAAWAEASFDAGSARRIAAHHNGKHGINPDDSSNGKAARGTAGRVGLGRTAGVART